jgi:competence protein ComEC
MCVLFQTENCDILITGDRNIRTEEMLLSRRQLPKLELLIAGHHGAENATGEKLLAMTQPEYVFISVGANNGYGHPAQEVLDRLAKYGCMVYCTDEYGTLIYKG